MSTAKAYPRLALCALLLIALALAAAPALTQAVEATPPAPAVGNDSSPATGGCCAGQACACGGEQGCACAGSQAGAGACAAAGCGHGPGAQARGMGGHGCMMGRMGGMQGGARTDSPPPGRGMGGMGPGAGQRALMHTAMSLVHQRQNIERTVEEIPGGVRTRTVVRGEDPALAATLVDHVEGMAGLLAGGGRVRNWDPLFSELFDHAAAISLDVEQIPNGVLVIETSEDPEVAKLIRAHAYKVNDFLARGHGAVHESTPIPADYHRPGAQRAPE